MIGKKIWVGILLVGLCLIGISGACFGEDKPNPPGPPPPQDSSKMMADFTKGLDKLVGEKVINAKQETIILDYYDKFFQQLKGLEPRQAGEKIDQLKKEKKDPLSLLIKDGILNQRQADAVAKAFPKPPAPPGGQHQPGGPQQSPPNSSGPNFGAAQPLPCQPLKLKEEFQKDLDDLVIIHGITSEQEKTIMQYYEPLFQKLEGTDPRAAFDMMEKLKHEGEHPLSRLVKDGVINQNQANIIAKLSPLPAAPCMPGPPPGQPNPNSHDGEKM